MNKLFQTKPGTLVFILMVGVFGIINTEMGVVGILPLIAENFRVTVPEAGWTVSAFAFIVALSAPVTPLLFSGVNRRTIMLLVPGIFLLSNIVSMYTSDFTILLIARAIPAFLHPVYVSMAFSVAAASVAKTEVPKAVAKVFIGVSAGMVLGVPVTSFIASEVSFAAAMFFFGTINALVLAATLWFVPSMPVTERLTYGTQIRVLRDPILWYSVIGFTLINGAMFGFFSYLSDFLKTVTDMPFRAISLILLVYGVANIIGNIAAGKLLVNNARRSMTAIPLVLGGTYILLFTTGGWPWAVGVIILILGILAGIASNVGQYMITDAAPAAPDFANGLFLTSANLGTTVGTTVCGLFLSGWGTHYTLAGALLFLLISIVFVFLRNHRPKVYKVRKVQKI